MKFSTKALSGALLGAAVILAPLAASAMDMKIGFVTINDSQHRVAEWFAKEVTKRTHGAITPRVFPAAQLGTIPREIEGIQFGTQEAFISPPGFFIGLNKAFQAADAPAMFENMEHQMRTLNYPTVREKFLNLATSKGVKGLFIYSAGGGAFATRDPVKKLSDLKGMKIRVLASPMERAMMDAIGVAGTPMAYSEVLPAIQRRVIDGSRSAIVVMGPSKFYTAAPNIVLTNGSFIPSGMWVSNIWFKKLSTEQQKILEETGKDATVIAQASALDIEAVWIKKWAQEGGTVRHFSKEDQAKLMATYKPLGDKLLGTDPAIAPMYELVKEAAKKTM